MIIDASRFVTVLGYLFLLCLSILIVIIAEKKLDWIGWIFLSLHGIIFYTVLAIDSQDTILHLGMFGIYGPVFYNLWSTALRIHSLVVSALTLMVIIRAMLACRGKIINGS